MNIKSLTELRAPKSNGIYDLFSPQIIRVYPNSELDIYTVQKGEDMRIDLVMMSIYQTESVLGDIDIILFINDIDNPLNIYPGQKIYYPLIDQLDSYRIVSDSEKSSSKVKDKLSIINKTTRTDNNRNKYVENGYSLPPVVLNTPQVPVRLEGQSILVGGVSKN